LLLVQDIHQAQTVYHLRLRKRRDHNILKLKLEVFSMIWRAAATASSLVLLTLSFRAEAQRPADIVHFTGSVTSWKGDTAQVVLNAAIQEGWHIYAIAQ